MTIRWILLGGLLWWGVINAQPQQHVLDWQTAVLRAVGYNPALQLQQLDVQLQRYQSRKTLSLFLPVIQYQNVNLRNIELPEFVFKIGDLEQRFRVGTPYNITHSLQLNWTLFAGGARWWGWRAQRHLQRAMESNRDGKTAETIVGVLNAYFSVLLNQEAVALQQHLVGIARQQLQRARQFAAAGTVTGLDTLQARSQYHTALSELTAAQHRQLLALENLKLLLNYPPGDTLILQDSLKMLQVLPPGFPLNRDSLRSLALRFRPELAASHETVVALGHQLKATYGKFTPTIVFNASVDHQAQVETLFPEATDYTRVKRATVTIQFPLFEGARRVIDVQEARARRRKAQLQYQWLERQLMLEVDQAYLTYQEARQKLPALKIARDQAAEALRQARLLFDEGVVTQLEVLTAQMQLKQTTLQWLKGIFEYNMAQFRLLKATGQLHRMFQ